VGLVVRGGGRGGSVVEGRGCSAISATRERMNACLTFLGAPHRAG